MFHLQRVLVHIFLTLSLCHFKNQNILQLNEWLYCYIVMKSCMYLMDTNSQFAHIFIPYFKICKNLELILQCLFICISPHAIRKQLKAWKGGAIHTFTQNFWFSEYHFSFKGGWVGGATGHFLHNDIQERCLSVLHFDNACVCMCRLLYLEL